MKCIGEENFQEALTLLGAFYEEYDFEHNKNDKCKRLFKDCSKATSLILCFLINKCILEDDLDKEKLRNLMQCVIMNLRVVFSRDPTDNHVSQVRICVNSTLGYARR